MFHRAAAAYHGVRFIVETSSRNHNEQANAWLWIVTVSITIGSLSLCHAALFGGGPHNYAGLFWMLFGFPAFLLQALVLTPLLASRIRSGIGTITAKSDFALAIGIAVAHAVGIVAIIYIGTRS